MIFPPLHSAPEPRLSVKITYGYGRTTVYDPHVSHSRPNRASPLPSTRPADPWPTSPLDQLRATATRHIDTHTNNNGLCRACKCAFPCPQAQLAEFTLDSL
jgi:hypothetical protein